MSTARCLHGSTARLCHHAHVEMNVIIKMLAGRLNAACQRLALFRSSSGRVIVVVKVEVNVLLLVVLVVLVMFVIVLPVVVALLST